MVRPLILLVACLATTALAEKPRAKEEPLVAEKGMWVLDSQHRNEKHVCEPNEEIEINGQSNTVKLTGPCKSVRVTGQGNTVSVEVTGSISVKGTNNTVTWKRATSGGTPRTTTTGTGNTVTRQQDNPRGK